MGKTLKAIMPYKATNKNRIMNLTDKGWQISFYSDEEKVSLNFFDLSKPEDAVTVEIGGEYKCGHIFSMIIPKEYAGYGFKINGKNYKESLEYGIISEEGSKKPAIKDYFGVDPKRVVSVVPSDAYNDVLAGDESVEIPSNELCIYKVHVRGFSRKNGLGTFEELGEKASYIHELGMNAVLLMPAYEFHELHHESEDNKYQHAPSTGIVNYWGYTGAYYYAPKAAYSKNAPIQEFKNMVKEFHRAGIGVFMEFNFDSSVSVTDALRILNYWKSEYHIDGVRLMCNEHIMCAVCCCEELADLTIISNYFTDGNIEYDTSYLTRRSRFVIYDGGYMWSAKHFLRADDDSLGAYLNDMTRKVFGHPVVNFICDNNGLSIADCFAYEKKHNSDNCENNKDGMRNNVSMNCGVEGETDDKAVIALRKKMTMNAQALLFLSSGIPLLMAGDEFGRTQKGNNNPYCQDNDISYLDWSLLKENHELYENVRKLIALRKKFSVLRPKREFGFTDYGNKGLPDISYHGENAWYPEIECYTKQVGVLYCGLYAENSKNIYVLYNMHKQDYDFAIPAFAGTWKMIFATEEDSVSFDETNRVCTVKGQTVAILES